MSEYLEDVRTYAPGASEASVASIVKYCGIALRNADSSLVSASDPKELSTVRDGFAAKKLGLDAAAADAGILAVVEKMKASLADKAKDVRVTFRLTDSPACLVADEHELSGNLMRMLKAAGQSAPDSKPILEINPEHPLVRRLKYEDAKFGDWSHLLFDQALLAEGGALTDPAAFVKRMNEMLLGMTG